MLRALHDAACAVEAFLDRGSASPWAEVAWWAYCLAWAAVERLNVGWDGFAQMVFGAIVFAIRREQARRDPRDDAAP